MPITPLSAELARIIEDQARSLGFPNAEAYLQVVFGTKGVDAIPPEVSDGQFVQVLDELSSEQNVPSLPDDFSRADVYSDHD